MSMVTMYIHLAVQIRTEAIERLAEIGDHTGCEAASARSFQEGRLDALKRLGLDVIRAEPQAADEEIHQRRRDLDEALRPSGTGQQMAFEPIVRTATIMTMTEPESTEEVAVEATEEPADDDAEETEAVEGD